jgi:Holliday junction resolvase
MNSKSKGKRGELDAVKWLKEHGFEARRGQQFAGGTDSPDVVSDLPFHIEVKRTERLRFDDAVDQAKRDANGQPWVVLHRKNHGPWYAVMDGENFLNMVREIADWDELNTPTDEVSQRTGNG